MIVRVALFERQSGDRIYKIFYRINKIQGQIVGTK
jgi:hypothetical protein